MHNLSGIWHGRYAFPHSYEPVPFIAQLRHEGDWLTGSIEESGLRSQAAGMTLTATVMGKAGSGKVTFLKTYDQNVERYDAVRYDGAVDEEGTEIQGTWIIPGNWSGTFLMIRPSPPAVANSNAKSERV